MVAAKHQPADTSDSEIVARACSTRLASSSGVTTVVVGPVASAPLAAGTAWMAYARWRDSPLRRR
jgi:hypothetical protein